MVFSYFGAGFGSISETAVCRLRKPSPLSIFVAKRTPEPVSGTAPQGRCLASLESLRGQHGTCWKGWSRAVTSDGLPCLAGVHATRSSFTNSVLQTASIMASFWMP